MKLIVVGLMDQAKGHYMDFARRWLATLRGLGSAVEVVGYVTSRSFAFEEFSRFIPSDAFFNILYDQRRECYGFLGKIQSLLIGVARGLQINWLLRRARCNLVFYLAIDLLAFPIANLVLPPPKNVKMVTIVHRAPVVPGIRGRVYRGSLACVLRRSDAVVVLEPSIKRQIVESLPTVDATKITVVPDPRFLENQCSLDNVASKKHPTTFAMVGIITPEKGAHIAVAAFASLTRELSDVRLVIAGQIRDETYKQYLYQLRDGNQSITITDSYLTTEEYFRLIRDADCMLLPYTSAAGARSSGVLLDVVSCDKPVIMSNIPSFAQYHDEFGLGEMCTPDSVTSLAAAVRDVVNGGVKESQIAAIAAVKRAHTPDVARTVLSDIVKGFERC